MIADLFLRTYPGDFKWLKFLFRSLETGVRGWRDIIIVVPNPDPDGNHWSSRLRDLNLAIGGDLTTVANQLRSVGAITGKIHVYGVNTTYNDDYIGQCETKLRAWEFTDADEVGFLDSDIIVVGRTPYPSLHRFWEPRGLHDLYDDWRQEIVLEYRPWNDAPDAKAAWYDVTNELLGKEPPFEFMCRHPFQYPTQFLQRAWRALVERRGGKPFDRHISEFNYLGNYAYLYEPDNFVFRKPSERGESYVHQFWSWGGVTIEVEDELRRRGLWLDGDKRDGV